MKTNIKTWQMRLKVAWMQYPDIVRTTQPVHVYKDVMGSEIKELRAFIKSLKVATVWHEGSKSFYKAALLEKIE